MPALNPPELRKQAAAKEAEAKQLFELVQKEEREPTDAEEARFATLQTEQTDLLSRAEKAERWVKADERFKTTSNSLGLVSAKDDPLMLPHDDEKNNPKGHDAYRLMKVLRHAMNPRKYPLDGLELEVHQEMEKDRAAHGHRGASGVNVPMNLAIDVDAARRFGAANGLARRDVSPNTSVSTVTGGATIPNELSTTLVEMFRARMITRQMGAKIMTDMQGNFAIPRQVTSTTFYMVTEGQNVTSSFPTLDQIPFTPHTGGVYTTWTRRFLEQTNLDAEQFVRNDQAEVVARGVETAALNGQAANGYPMGIMQNPLVPVVAGGTNGAAPTWDNIVALETAVAASNADVGTLGYITDATTRGKLKTTAKIGSTFPIYLWNSESSTPLNGYPVGVTNLLPLLSKGSATGTLHALLFGNWADLIYAFWSGLDVIVDPYTQAASGSVNIVTLQDFDVNIRHPESFAFAIDVATA